MYMFYQFLSSNSCSPFYFRKFIHVLIFLFISFILLLETEISQIICGEINRIYHSAALEGRGNPIRVSKICNLR